MGNITLRGSKGLEYCWNKSGILVAQHLITTTLNPVSMMGWREGRPFCGPHWQTALTSADGQALRAEMRHMAGVRHTDAQRQLDAGHQLRYTSTREMGQETKIWSSSACIWRLFASRKLEQSSNSKGILRNLLSQGPQNEAKSSLLGQI